jgi:hypothetical protein
MNLVIALAAVGLINTGVVYIIADDVLSLPAPLTGTQSLAIGMAVTLVPLIVLSVLDVV